MAGWVPYIPEREERIIRREVDRKMEMRMALKSVCTWMVMLEMMKE